MNKYTGIVGIFNHLSHEPPLTLLSMEEEWQEKCRMARHYFEQKQPRAQGKRFDTSVPKWMRSAIEAGLVQTNSKEVYTIYSEGERVVKVERREQEVAVQGEQE